MTRDVRGLDSPLDEFRRQLVQSIDVILAHYAKLYDVDAFRAPAEDVVADWFDEPLPEKGIDFDELIELVQDTVVDPSTVNLGTKMFAYVMSGGNQISVCADLLAAALDQNVAKWHLAPSITEIEKRVIDWTAKFIGYDDKSGGAIVSGGSAANLTGLSVARNIFLENEDVRKRGLFKLPALRVYGSAECHSSLAKSIQLLGIGSENFVTLPTRDDYSLDVGLLRQAIIADRESGYRPFCIIGNAGTVNTGAIDPLVKLAEIAREFGLWFHIDGCYGGLAASLPEKSDLYVGLHAADSVALDFHKWLYQPFEVGCTLVKSWDLMRRSFHTAAAYLDTDKQAGGRFDITDHHFDLSRNAKALKVWMSFKAYGAARLGEMIRKDIALTEYLCAQVDRSSDFELVSQGPLAIACFRYLGQSAATTDQIDKLNRELIPALERDGRVFITGTVLDQRPVIRACTINHRSLEVDIDYLLAIIREVGGRLEA